MAPDCPASDLPLTGDEFSENAQFNVYSLTVPDVSASTTQLNFGSTRVGDVGSTQTVTFTNKG